MLLRNGRTISELAAQTFSVIDYFIQVHYIRSTKKAFLLCLFGKSYYTGSLEGVSSIPPVQVKSKIKLWIPPGEK